MRLEGLGGLRQGHYRDHMAASLFVLPLASPLELDTIIGGLTSSMPIDEPVDSEPHGQSCC